jgi:peptidoglycan/LPS O-acetylase OafA/YrhL
MALGYATTQGEHPGTHPADAVAPADDPRPGLPHVPALDGLRGLAVGAVLIFHLGHLRGGFLGVDLFFVLSGFLITSLLLGGRRGRDRVDLGLFWSRRARRLLPALFLLLAGVAVLIAVYTPETQRPLLRGDALATLGYVANWHAMGHQTTYWDLFTVPSPLDHMWSLAIEEQFYLVWPLVVGGLLLLAQRRGRSAHGMVAGVAVAGAAASFTVLAVTWSAVAPNRAYYGTDARIGPTLLGAALAALWVSRPWVPVPAEAAEGAGGDGAAVPWRRWCGPALALACLGYLVWAFARVEGTAATYYRGGLVAFALAAVVLMGLLISGRGGPVARVLSWRPLCVLGLISYGVYLWHWPVIVYLTPERLHVPDGWRRMIICIAVTLALAGLSYVLVERPIRRGALKGRRVPIALVGAIATCAVLAVVVTNGETLRQGPQLVADQAGTAKYPLHSMPFPLPKSGPKIMLVGDSGPIFLGPALTAEAAKHGVAVASDSQYGCTPLDPEGVTRWGDGILRFKPCHDFRRKSWGEMLDQFDPDVVIYYIASLNVPQAMLLNGQWVADCDPPYDAYLRTELGKDIAVLQSGGATVALGTTPLAPASGATPRGPDMLACRNELYRQVVADHPGTRLINLKGAVAAAAKVRGKDAFRDAVHLSDFGARYVSRWLVPTALALRNGTPLPSVADTYG